MSLVRTVPRKRFGQHFLHERGIIERIVRSINAQPDDVLIEVGPGEGALTRPLLECVPRMDAIEIDRDLAARLAAEFSPERLTLHIADVLEFDFSVFPEGMRVVGNLPYNISTPMLFHLARYASRVRDMHFMLQLEVVERMVAKHSTKRHCGPWVLTRICGRRTCRRRITCVSSGAWIRLARIAASARCMYNENSYIHLQQVAMRTTRVFSNGNSQAVRLPKEFRLAAGEVFIRKDAATGDIVLSTRPASGSWSDFFALRAKTRVPDDFLSDRPLNETKEARDPFATPRGHKPVRRK